MISYDCRGSNQSGTPFHKHHIWNWVGLYEFVCVCTKFRSLHNLMGIHCTWYGFSQFSFLILRWALPMMLPHLCFWSFLSSISCFGKTGLFSILWFWFNWSRNIRNKRKLNCGKGKELLYIYDGTQILLSQKLSNNCKNFQTIAKTVKQFQKLSNNCKWETVQSAVGSPALTPGFLDGRHLPSPPPSSLSGRKTTTDIIYTIPTYVWLFISPLEQAIPLSVTKNPEPVAAISLVA